MEVTLTRRYGTWLDVVNAARTTVNKDDSDREPTSKWKYKMLKAEHSPIRLLGFEFILEIPYWVSVHLTRHKIGIEHFVTTQRSDRTGVPRDELPQGAMVNHKLVANAQALITISRKRLCKLASPETLEAWAAVVATLKEVEPELYEACQPDCVYRGGVCWEMQCCGLFPSGFGEK